MSSTTGLPRTFMTFVAYLFGWISGLVVLLVEKSDSHVRFHAAQSVVFFGAGTLLGILLPIIPVIGGLALKLLGLVLFVVWLVQLVTSLLGKPFTLPVVSQFATLLTLKL
jgi:uncharacterized membrane protein